MYCNNIFKNYELVVQNTVIHLVFSSQLLQTYKTSYK